MNAECTTKDLSPEQQMNVLMEKELDEGFNILFDLDKDPHPFLHVLNRLTTMQYCLRMSLNMLTFL